jgi:hypothetical protein
MAKISKMAEISKMAFEDCFNENHCFFLENCLLLQSCFFFRGTLSIAYPITQIIFIELKKHSYHSLPAVSLARKFWLFILRNRYPYLEFAKRNNIRSLVDTSRNPGVFHVLLKVEGNCDFGVIKETLRRHVVDRVDTLGRLIFPRLKLPLISCWGHYAWIKNFE